jgi:hypothetical protein
MCWTKHPKSLYGKRESCNTTVKRNLSATLTFGYDFATESAQVTALNGSLILASSEEPRTPPATEFFMPGKRWIKKAVKHHVYSLT